MSYADIEHGLVEKALSVLGATPTAHENSKPFEKPDNLKWCAVFFLPNPPSVETLGDQGEDKTDGIFQIDYNYQMRTGTKASADDYQLIRDAFPAGERLVHNGQITTITGTGQSSRRIVDKWNRVSVTVRWYALIKRR